MTRSMHLIRFALALTLTATAAFAANAQAAALPANGGAPGKAYIAYVAALKTGNLDDVTKAMSKSRAAEVMSHSKDPQFKMMFGFMQSQIPKHPKYVKGDSEGDKATLTYTGKNDDGGMVTITARMVREGGAWKVDKDESNSTVK